MTSNGRRNKALCPPLAIMAPGPGAMFRVSGRESLGGGHILSVWGMRYGMMVGEGAGRSLSFNLVCHLVIFCSSTSSRLSFASRLFLFLIYSVLTHSSSVSLSRSLSLLNLPIYLMSVCLCCYVNQVCIIPCHRFITILSFPL